MNAITIQQREDGQWLITAPGDEGLLFNTRPELHEVLQNFLNRLTPEAGLHHRSATIPQRLENQAAMILKFANLLNCTATDSGIQNAIIKLKGRLEKSSARATQAETERDGLKRLFNGVAVERNADGKITKIRASNTVERNNACDIVFEERRDIGRLQKRDGIYVERNFVGQITKLTVTNTAPNMRLVTEHSDDTLRTNAEERHDTKTPVFPGYAELRATLEEKWRETITNREEILTAFIAKHGCGPDEVEQIEQPAWPGSYLRVWSVRKKSKSDTGLRVKHIIGAVPKAEADNSIFEHGKPAGFEHGGIVPRQGVQLCERCGAAQPYERPFHAIPFGCVNCGASLSNPVMTGHKEKLIQELRRLWNLGATGDGSGSSFSPSTAKQIDNLLATPPAFHEPGEKSTLTRCEELRAECDQLQSDLKLACQQRAEALLKIDRLRATLQTISNWKEFPPTGDEHSYAWHWGSNGERDHMRNLAKAALDDTL